MADEASKNIAEAISFVRSREATKVLAGQSLATAITMAINDIDSGQEDPVADLSEGTQALSREGVRAKLGKLQRVQAMREVMLGEDGILSQLKKR
jgi:hypothetical protein